MLAPLPLVFSILREGGALSRLQATSSPLKLWAKKSLPRSHPVARLIRDLPAVLDVDEMLVRVDDWFRLIRWVEAEGSP